MEGRFPEVTEAVVTEPDCSPHLPLSKPSAVPPEPCPSHPMCLPLHVFHDSLECFPRQALVSNMAVT